MANILILKSLDVSAIASSRGAPAPNLLTNSPKEVWIDTAVGASVNIDINLGSAQTFDTIALCAIYGAVAGATWSISGGTTGFTDFAIKSSGALRAIDPAGAAPSVSHALWTGASQTAQYVRLVLTQPSGAPLQIGRLMLGKAFVPTWNNEWGAGRKVIDTGAATRLLDGGFAVVEGARAGAYAWTFGDLTTAEVDVLYRLQLDQGETAPVLVVEDPAATTGQLYRIHYGLLTNLRAFERRNPAQTRWELSMEEWI